MFHCGAAEPPGAHTDEQLSIRAGSAATRVVPTAEQVCVLSLLTTKEPGQRWLNHVCPTAVDSISLPRCMHAVLCTFKVTQNIDTATLLATVVQYVPHWSDDKLSVTTPRKHLLHLQGKPTHAKPQDWQRGMCHGRAASHSHRVLGWQGQKGNSLAVAPQLTCYDWFGVGMPSTAMLPSSLCNLPHSLLICTAVHINIASTPT